MQQRADGCLQTMSTAEVKDSDSVTFFTAISLFHPSRHSLMCAVYNLGSEIDLASSEVQYELVDFVTRLAVKPRIEHINLNALTLHFHRAMHIGEPYTISTYCIFLHFALVSHLYKGHRSSPSP